MIDSLERSLGELRAELSPSSADKARLRARIVAPALAGEAYAPPAPLSRWGALKAAGSVGLATGALLLGAGVGVGFWLGREASPPRAGLPAAVEPTSARPTPAQPSEPTPLAAEQPAPTASEPLQVASSKAAPSEPRRGPPRARVTRKAAAPNPLNDELALLRRVERALRNADPELALALLGELDERFPDTPLVEERQAARLMAGCRLNDAAAVARAHAFLHDNPASVYRQRVQLACESGAAPKQADDATMQDVVAPDTSGR